MRSSLPLLIMAAWAVAPTGWSQTPAPQPAAAQPAAAHQPAAPQAAATKQTATHVSQTPPKRHATWPSAASAAHGAAPAVASAGNIASTRDGVLALGATDITGNKELPKVMVIVPWKDSMGAGGVIKPTDSLMDEALEPVDRGVFQRRIRYYGELNAAGAGPPGSKVAPVGDSH